MKRIFLIICTGIFLTNYAFCQRTATVCGEVDYKVPESQTIAEAKLSAIRQARLKAIADEFGTNVVQINSTAMGNADGKTNISFTSYGEDDVRGVWISDTREPETSILSDNDQMVIRAKVCGKVREIVVSKAELNVRLLKEPYKEAEADVFKNEQSFYLYLQSPVAGFLAVYLLDLDEDMAYCLLPGANDSRGAYPIESNKEYIFFNDNISYMFTTTRAAIVNHIVVVFSPKEFYKAIDSQGHDDKYILPRELPMKQFQQWISKCKARDNQLVEKNLQVKIIR